MGGRVGEWAGAVSAKLNQTLVARVGQLRPTPILDLTADGLPSILRVEWFNPGMIGWE